MSSDTRCSIRATELISFILTANSSLYEKHVENVRGREMHLPLLKEEVETCTPGRDRSTNLTG